MKNSTHLHNTCWAIWKTQSSHSLPKRIWAASLLRLKGPRCIYLFLKVLEKVNWHNARWFKCDACARKLTHKGKNKTQSTHLQFESKPSRREKWCVSTTQIYSTLVLHPSLSRLFFCSFTLCQPLSSQTVSPISSFLPELTSFFRFTLSTTVSSPLWISTPDTFPLNHSFSLLLSSSIFHNFPSSPRPPSSCPLTHVLMKQKAPLIAPFINL